MNELEKYNGGLPAVESESWGSEGAAQADILIPRLQLMQDLSELVKTRQADSGDYVDSSTGKILIKKGQAGEFIPLTMHRDWLISDVDPRDGKAKFRQKGGVVRMTPENENLPTDDVDNETGLAIKRHKSINLFVLFVPKLDELPFMISFKKAGQYAGKQLATYFKVCQAKRVPPASQVWSLSSAPKTYNGYSFFVGSVKPCRDTTTQELAIAKQWYQSITSKSVEVQDEISEGADLSFDPSQFNS